MKYLMVCLGNICRSPLAQGILKEELLRQGISAEVDSAGFEPFHQGDPADARSVAVARRHGIDIRAHRARLFKSSDFDTYDKIYVMDRTNYSDVENAARNRRDMEKVDYIMNVLQPGQDMPVPDPYYGGTSHFEEVFQMLENACQVIATSAKQA